MLKCKDIAHRASEFIEHDKPGYQKLGWYMHLAICNNCRRFVKQFKLSCEAARRFAGSRAGASDEQVNNILNKIDRRPD